MPLKIETLFCDAAVERDILSGDELNMCLERAGEGGCLHREALRAGFVTEPQVRRVYRRVYDDLDRRYHKLRQAHVTCDCGEHLAARFGLAYRVVYCPSCLEPLELGRQLSRAATHMSSDVVGVDTHELTHIARQAGLLASSAEEPAVGPGAPDEPDELPPYIIGYETIERLADHGMGAIYRCRGKRGDRVIRVVPRKGSKVDIDRLLREWKALAKLEHPNIRPLRKVKRDEEHYYFVSEYLPGQNLEQLRARSGRLRPRLVLKVASQIAQALACAHDAGLLHGGLTPVRVVVSDIDKRVLVLDFGLGYSADAMADYVVTGELEGHPGFISPEQVLGEEFDHRADLYSLGMLMTYCLVGQLPFGDDPPSAVYKQAHGQFPTLSELIPDLEPSVVRLVDRLVARDPEHRYPDADTLLGDLGYIISGKAPQFVSGVADRVSLARIRKARAIQGEAADAGQSRRLADVLQAQGLLDDAEGSVEEIFVADPYTCIGCGVDYDADEAIDARFVCKGCGAPLRFDRRVALVLVRERLVVQPRGDFLADPARVEQLDTHLRAAVGRGLTKVVVDVATSASGRGAECAWTVALADAADKCGGGVDLLFGDEREHQQFAALGFDRFVRVRRSRTRFYRKLGLDAPPTAKAEVRALSQPEIETERDAVARARERLMFAEPLPEGATPPERRQLGALEDSGAAALPPGGGAGAGAGIGLAGHSSDEAAFEPEFLDLYDAEDFDAALALLERRYDPAAAFSPRWSYHLAVCRWRTGDAEGALHELARVRELAPSHAEAPYLEGRILQTRGALEQAVDSYSRTIELEPDHVKALCNRGALRYSLERLDAARADFEAALAVNPRHVRALFGLGTICVERGQLQLADELLRQALANDPEFAWTYYTMARLAARRERQREALIHLRQAVARDGRLYERAEAEEDFDALRADKALGPHYRTLAGTRR